MTNVLVLGASGQIARRAIPMLAKQGSTLTLFARDRLKINAPEGARVLEGDVLDTAALRQALAGQDLVYANLGGEISKQAEILVEQMRDVGVQRLIFIVSLGIYQELPQPFQQWNDQMIGEALVDYRRAADIIEASGLDYTIIRPAWLTNHEESEYELTQRDEQFKGTEVSRTAVASFIASLIANPGTYSRANVGINKPGTDADKPAWY